MFDTGILDRAIRAKQGARDRERRAMLVRVADALRDMRQRFGIREAHIVGSLLQAHRWNETSDVDVAVGGCSAHILNVMEAIEEATGREVDVVDLDRHTGGDSFRLRGMKIYG